MLLKNVRLGYPKLYKAEAIQGVADAKPRYGCQLLLPKTDIAGKALLDAAEQALAKLHWKGVLPKSKDRFVKDGDGEDGDEHSKGHWIVSANRAEGQGRPQVIDRDRTAIDSADANTKVYAGCYVNALISVFKPKAFGKTCASLEVIQRVKDGDRFGAGVVSVDDVMPDLADDEEEDFDV